MHLSCPRCAAPLPDHLVDTCPSCGTAAELPPGARRRIAAHQGRIARAGARLEASRRFDAELRAAGRLGGPFAALLIAGLLAVVGGPMLLMVALLSYVWTAVAVLIGALAFAVAALAGGLAFTLLTGALTRRGTARLLAALPPLDPAAVSCPACGGQHRALPGVTAPCPWCEASVVIAPEASAGAVAQRAAQAEAAGQDAEQALERLLARAGQRRRGRSVGRTGLTLQGGLLAGVIGGSLLWGAGTRQGLWVVQRLELEAPLALDRAWLLGPEPLQGARAVGEGLGLPLAGAGAALPDPEPLSALVGSLQLGEALLVDPAGISWWRRVPLHRALFRPYQRVEVLAPLLAGAAERLRVG
ncbi:MAG: hypothetical protein JXX28_15180 [Deltaproteobacteria bacterium]|nr:hypothetical protein [Deltaproteobacteria bacterium]